MASENIKAPKKAGILLRFGYLLSAQGVDAALSAVFFLYLAWLNSSLYGEVMYALAASSIVMTMVDFGLYYPLVVNLGAATKEESGPIIVRVIALRLILLIPATLFIGGMIMYRKFSLQMGIVFFLICLGVALESVAETFFAGMRVEGRQDKEARIKITANTAAYMFGFLTAALGAPPLVVGFYKLVSASVKLLSGIAANFGTVALRLMRQVRLSDLKIVFLAALVFALIDILGNFYNKTNIFFIQKVAGITSVAYYTATWNIVDGISVLASSQFLAWVIFPLLASTYAERRSELGNLVRTNALWLLVIAFPLMMILAVESNLIIRLLYPPEYSDAAWMQKMLVWTIVLSFENNLFCYLMMVAGAGRMLLLFASLVTVTNLVLNAVLVPRYGLVGACLVIIFTKMSMTILTFSYCQERFGFFQLYDLVMPATLGVGLVGLYVFASTFIHYQVALASALAAYGAGAYLWGPKRIGRPNAV